MKKWTEISVLTTQEAIEPVANILHEAGASGVVIEDSQDLTKTDWQKHIGDIYEYNLNPDDYPEEGVIIKAYLPVNSFLGETVEEIKTELNNLLMHDINLGRGTVTLTEVQEEDWAHAWKKYYKPVKISETITITPTWEDYTPASPNEKIIELDPGMAFGTGTHPTTILCIQAMEDYLPKGSNVIDVGTGSGVLSIAAMKLGAERVLALDIDDLAVKVARENTKVNGVSADVTVKQNNLLDHIEEEVDVIVSNILAEVIIRFVDDAYKLVKSGGYFITSGIISKKKDEVKEALTSQGFTVVETLLMEDWVAFISQKK